MFSFLLCSVVTAGFLFAKCQAHNVQASIPRSKCVNVIVNVKHVVSFSFLLGKESEQEGFDRSVGFHLTGITKSSKM